jgi:hypothetical protein
VSLKVLATILLSASDGLDRVSLVVARRWFRFGEEAFPDGASELADSRQAGDNDADVRFDCGPVSDRQVIPSDVVRVGELNQVL